MLARIDEKSTVASPGQPRSFCYSNSCSINRQRSCGLAEAPCETDQIAEPEIWIRRWAPANNKQTSPFFIRTGSEVLDISETIWDYHPLEPLCSTEEDDSFWGDPQWRRGQGGACAPPHFSAKSYTCPFYIWEVPPSYFKFKYSLNYDLTKCNERLFLVRKRLREQK